MSLGPDDKKTYVAARTNSVNHHKHKHKRDDKRTHCDRKCTYGAGLTEDNFQLDKQGEQTNTREKHSHEIKSKGIKDVASNPIVTRSLKRKMIQSLATEIVMHDKHSFTKSEVPEGNESANQKQLYTVNGEDTEENSDLHDFVHSLKVKLPKKRKSERQCSNGNTKLKEDSTMELGNLGYSQPVRCDEYETARNDAKFTADISCTGQRNEKYDDKNTEKIHDVYAENLETKDILTYPNDLLDENYFINKATAVNDILDSLPEILIAKTAKTKRDEKEATEHIPIISNEGATKVNIKNNHKDGYHCNECDATFKYQKAFNKHKKNGACVFLCSYCGRKYTARYYSNYLLHVKYHINDRQHVCSQCGKAFAEKCKLTSHLRSHSNERLFVCDSCGQSFNTSAILRSHIKCLHTERPKNFQCELCDRRFVTIYNLNTHMRVTHSSDRPFECQICRKTFKTRYALEKNHMLCHHDNGRLLHCHLCPKSFKTKEYLNMHMKRHKNDRTHFCGICNKGFYDNKTLREHSRIHSGEKPFSCSFCEYKCALKGNLTKHMKVHANEEDDESDTDDSGELETEIGILENDIQTSVRNLKNWRLEGNDAVILNSSASTESDCRAIEKNVNRDPVFNHRQFSGQDSFSVLSLLNRDSCSSNSELQNVIATEVPRCQDLNGTEKEVSKTNAGVSTLHNVVLMTDNDNSGLANELSNSLLMFSGLLCQENNVQYQDSPNDPSLVGVVYRRLEPSIPQNDMNYMQYGSSFKF